MNDWTRTDFSNRHAVHRAFAKQRPAARARDIAGSGRTADGDAGGNCYDSRLVRITLSRNGDTFPPRFDGPRGTVIDVARVHQADGGSRRRFARIVYSLPRLPASLHEKGQATSDGHASHFAAVADALYAKLASLPLGWHEAHHSAHMQQRARQASVALADFTQSQFLYLQNFVNVIGPLVAKAHRSSRTGT